MRLQTLEKEIREWLAPKKALVKRRARGSLKHDYLVPGGPYEEQWDWDAFFVGMALASDIPSEATYLKHWCLNYLEHTQANGFTPGLLTPRGIDKRLKHIKPFLAQGAYFASTFLHDFSWIRPHWSTLKKSIAYRKRMYHDKRTGLACWYNSMESGADNNVAAFDYPTGTVLAADLNTFLYREYQALARIARKLGKQKDARIFQTQAHHLKRSILHHLWDKKDQTFYNVDRRTGQFIRRVSYSNIIPLWAGLAPKAKAKEMIRRYVMNPAKLWARHGVRTLAKDDPSYNNANIIKPYSNWQGPVWPIANYLTLHALLNYGFRTEARALATKIVRICLNDLKQTRGMHENYHADTGTPLAAPQFISWNLLVGNMIEEATTGRNPFAM